MSEFQFPCTRNLNPISLPYYTNTMPLFTHQRPTREATESSIKGVVDSLRDKLPIMSEKMIH